MNPDPIPQPQSSRPTSLSLANFPPELLLCLGRYLPGRLGLPLNKYLLEVLSRPCSIADRAVRRYGTSRALILEAGRDAPRTSEVVRQVLKYPGVRDRINDAGWHPIHRTPLKEAARAGLADVVQVLLHNGATVRDVRPPWCKWCHRSNPRVGTANIDPSEYSALSMAVFKNDVCIVGMLLGDMTAGWISDLAKDRALKLAINSDMEKTEIVQVLLANGATLRTDEDRRVILREATRGRTALVRLLLEFRVVETDFSFPFGWTALALASSNGHLDTVRTLLDNHADVHVAGDLPLRVAVRNGHVDIVRLLLQHGANAAKVLASFEPASTDVGISHIPGSPKDIDGGEVPPEKAIGVLAGISDNVSTEVRLLMYAVLLNSSYC